MKLITPATPKQPQLTRVAAYCRISMETDRTRKSLSTQVSYYNKLIASTPGWVFAGVFADCGISGTHTANRTEFQAMLAKARAGDIDLILTKSISRFARNTVDLLETVRELKSLGVEVRFERENISSISADGELMLTLLASFAQAESEQLSQNVQWRVRKGFEQGKANGFHLYGYTDSADATDVEIIDAEAEVVRRVYRNYLDGISCEETAVQLAAEGVASRQGKPLGAETLRSWLRQESYTGTLTLGRWISSSFGVHSRPNEGEQEMYRVENAIPAIIDQATFGAVQAERERRRQLGALANKAIPTTTFTHMVYCPGCQKYYRSAVDVAYDGTRCRKWVCATRRERGHGCDSKRIPQTSLEQIVCDALGLEEFDDEVFLDRVERIDIPDPDTAVVRLHGGASSTHTIAYPAYRKDFWDDPGYRQRHGDKLRAYWANLTDEERAQVSKQRANNRRRETAQEKEVRVKKCQDAWTPERRARQADIARRVNENVTSEERKRRGRKAHETMQADPSINERKSQKMKEHWADPNYRRSTTAAMKGRCGKKKEGK